MRLRPDVQVKVALNCVGMLEVFLPVQADRESRRFVHAKLVVERHRWDAFMTFLAVSASSAGA